MPQFVATRTSWHAIAEQVLARARWEATRKIGLRAEFDGVGTPYFGDDRRLLLGVDGLTIEQYGERTTAPLTTLAAAAEFVGTPLGAPPGVYTASTSLEPNEPLTVDPASASVLASWFGFARSVLSVWRDEHHDDDPSLLQLWPEHFDVAVDLGDADEGTRANYGASPGDDLIAEPYLYVGPWATDDLDDPFWNQPWGAALPYSALSPAPNPSVLAESFLAHGRTRLVER